MVILAEGLSALLAIRQDLCEAVRCALEAYSVQCEVAASMEDAIERCLSSDFDMIVLDRQSVGIRAEAASSILRRAGCASLIIGWDSQPSETHEGDGADDFHAVLGDPIVAATIEPVLQMARARRASVADVTLAWQPDVDDLEQMFREQVPGILGAIRQAALGGDVATLARQIHQLKGCAGSFGFPTITGMCAAIAQHLHAGLTERAVAETLDMSAILARLSGLPYDHGKPALA